MQRIITLSILILCVYLNTTHTTYAQDLDKEESLTVDGLPFYEKSVFDEGKLSLGEEVQTKGSLPLMTEVNFTTNGVERIINYNSRINPENQIQSLGERETSLETKLTLSDFLNSKQTSRWLIKMYGFYSSEEDARGGRINMTRIDEAFFDWKSGDFFFNIGKRRINWGHAMAFNPVNVIVPPRDPLNPNLETEWHPVIWTSYSSNICSLHLFLTRDFDKDWNSDLYRWGSRIDEVIGEFDCSLYYFDGEPYADDRKYERMYGVSFSTNLAAGMTLYSEIAGFEHNYRKYYEREGIESRKDRFYTQVDVGSYIILDPESFLSFFNGDANLLLEAYYNGGGYSKTERKQYLNTLDKTLLLENQSALEDYRFAGMDQFYFLCTYSNSFRERYTTELTGLIAQDLSFSLQGELKYNLSDYYDLAVKLTHNQGDKESEFGNDPTSTLLKLTIDINFCNTGKSG